MSLRAFSAIRPNWTGPVPELAGMGLAMLIALSAVAASNWDQYERTPEDFDGQIEAATEALRTSSWPAHQQEQFALFDVAAHARQAMVPLTPLEGPRYGGRFALFQPLRADEPQLKPVEDLRAVARRTILLTSGSDPNVLSDHHSTRPSVPPRYESGADAQPGPVRTTPSGRGLRYVAVTGVVPHRSLVSGISTALRLTRLEAEQTLVYRDVHIERQRTDEAGEGDWRRLDLQQMLLQIGDEWAGAAPEVVRPEQTHPVFTMPLPPRAMGSWLRDGSHPRFDAEPEPPRRHAASLGQGLFPPTSLRRPQEQEPGAPASAQRADRLLFRFVDCDVTPEATYRYRVRLAVNNPLWGRNPMQVRDPDLVGRETLETPWSEPTAPITFEPDAQSFLARVLRRYGRATSISEWDVFQWNPELGTLEASTLRLTNGEQVVGRAHTEQLNVLAGTLARTWVDFLEPRFLVDTQGGPGINQFDYPDLKLEPAELRALWESHLTDQVLVADLKGRITEQSPPGNTNLRHDAWNRHARQMEAFAGLRLE